MGSSNIISLVDHAILLIILIINGVTAIFTWSNGRRAKARSIATQAVVVGLAEKVEEVHKATNGLQDKMLAAKVAEINAAATAQYALGLATGIAEGKAEHNITDNKK